MPSSENQPLNLHETGAFGALTRKPNPSALVVVTYPLFELMLPILERRAGRKLTQDEIQSELAQAPAVALAKEDAEEYLAASRRGKHSQ
ncbi:MAG TPA: hypothetical protein VG269_00700 [Tepidisphaeraceae bacterium]|jgi:hypothetical protein|nr:hypothetical protein [Tepidisphaeraceae bacterium]